MKVSLISIFQIFLTQFQILEGSSKMWFAISSAWQGHTKHACNLVDLLRDTPGALVPQPIHPDVAAEPVNGHQVMLSFWLKEIHWYHLHRKCGLCMDERFDRFAGHHFPAFLALIDHFLYIIFHRGPALAVSSIFLKPQCPLCSWCIVCLRTPIGM